MIEMPLDLKDALRIIKKRYQTIAVILGVFIIAAIIINYMISPTYQAQTTVRIKQPKGLGDSLLWDMPRGSASRQLMATYGEILKSRTVVMAVRDDIQNQLAKRPTFGSITTQPVKDTELMMVAVQAKTPEEAQLAADALVQKFTEQITYLSRAEQTMVREFIGERLQESKRNLEKAENTLELYKRKEKILTPDVETNAMAARLASISKLKADNSIALAAAQAKLANAQQNLSQGRVEYMADNPMIQQYKSNLVTMEADLVGLLEKYTEKHPQVIATKSKIGETKARLNEEIIRVVNAEAPTSNPIHLALIQNKMQAEAEIDVVTAQNNAIDQVLADSEKELTKLPSKEQGLGRVLRDVTVAQEIYVMLAKRYEEARISEVMKPTNLEIIDSAIASGIPVRPNKQKNIIIAGVLGLVTGIALVFVQESLNKSMRTAEDVKHYLDLPILGSIPAFDKQDELAARPSGWG